MELTWILFFAAFLGSETLVTGNVLKTRSSDQFGIIHGNNASITQYPFMASVYFGGLRGSGIILNDTWILTSALNVYGAILSYLTVRVGSDQFDKGGQELQVEKVVCHDDYDEGVWDYDVALVKVQKMKMGKKVKAVQLGTTKLEPNTKVKIVGWGAKTEKDEQKKPSEQLLDATLKVLNWKTCRKTYSYTLTERMMCTAFKSTHPSDFDYGDPLVSDDGKVYGLWSGAFTRSPAVFSCLPEYIQWINSIINS